MTDVNLKSINLKSLEWPSLLRTPSELKSNLKNVPSNLIKSPIGSKLVLQIVGGCAYLLCHHWNHLKVFNGDTFNHELRLLEQNNRNQNPGEDDESEKRLGKLAFDRVKSPLITYSNHISCLDDPLLWGCLFPWNYYTTQTDSIRWSAAAIDICFTNRLHSAFFSLGKTFPVVRGVGLQQPGMDYASGMLNHNQWLHLFPEGRVMRDRNQNVLTNVDRGYTFKWGIAKLIIDYLMNLSEQTRLQDKTIRILPFYHLGLDEIFPVGGSYIPFIGKRISILIRDSTIRLNNDKLIEIFQTHHLHMKARKSKTEDQLKLIKLTNYLEEELEQLKESTYKLHNVTSDDDG